MRFQAGTQIVLIVISIVIVFTVVKPKFSEISFQQNEMMTYRTALDNISRYNQRLKTLISQADAMETSERENLFRYLPETIDAVVVGRDIANMAENNNLLLLDIEPSDPAPVTVTVATEQSADTGLVAPPTEDQGAAQQAGGMYAQEFKVSVVGSYEDMKTFLKDIERNAYPLRLLEFAFTIENTDNALLEYNLTLETYSLKGS